MKLHHLYRQNRTAWGRQNRKITMHVKPYQPYRCIMSQDQYMTCANSIRCLKLTWKLASSSSLLQSISLVDAEIDQKLASVWVAYTRVGSYMSGPVLMSFIAKRWPLNQKWTETREEILQNGQMIRNPINVISILALHCDTSQAENFRDWGGKQLDKTSIMTSKSFKS